MSSATLFLPDIRLCRGPTHACVIFSITLEVIIVTMCAGRRGVSLFSCEEGRAVAAPPDRTSSIDLEYRNSQAGPRHTNLAAGPHTHIVMR